MLKLKIRTHFQKNVANPNPKAASSLHLLAKYNPLRPKYNLLRAKYNPLSTKRINRLIKTSNRLIMKEIDQNPSIPPLSHKQISQLISSPVRWGILHELSKGEALPAAVLAGRLNKRPNTITQNLILMRKLGVLHRGYGRLYSIAPALLPNPASQIIDLQYCQLNFTKPPTDLPST